MCKLDRSSGILFDHALGSIRSVGKSGIVFDELPAPLRRAQRRPAERERTLTVTVDCALRAAREQRTAADHARENSPLARLIPNYNRLP